MALPNIFATLPAGNVAASKLDANFTFLESQGVQAAVTTGSSNAYVATLADAWLVGYSAYAGRALTLVPNFTNTGTTSLNVSGLGAVDVYKQYGTTTHELVAGDIVSGVPIVVVCDGTNFYLDNPANKNIGNGVATSLNLGNDNLLTYKAGTWTPVWTSLTVVGTPTYTGTYVKIGKLVKCQLNIVSTTSTASAGGTTTLFTGLPFVPAGASALSAVNGATAASYGVGLVNAASSGTGYPPSWPAVANVVLDFSYNATTN